MSSWPWAFRALEECAEAIEAGLQHPAVLRDPGRRVLEPAGAHPAVPHPSDFLGRHETGSFEDRHVLLHAREGHLEAGSQIADRGVPAPEALEDATASRVGQRRERSIELW